MRTTHGLKVWTMLGWCAWTGVPTARAAIAEETRPVPGFSSLEVRSAIDVHVRQGPVAPLRVRGEPDTLARLRAEVKAGHLRLYLAPKAPDTKHRVVVELQCPSLPSLRAAEASVIETSAPAGGPLRLVAAEASTIRVAASVAPSELTVEAADASEVVVEGLRAHRLTARARSASRLSLAGHAASARVVLQEASSLEGRGLSVKALEIHESEASRATVSAQSVSGSLGGAASLDVPRSARVAVTTAEESSVIRH